MTKPILEIKELKTSFKAYNGLLPAVDGVSLTVNEGEIVGVVGESGCGKSVTAQSILRLFDERKEVKYEGEISYGGVNLLSLKAKQMSSIRGNDISMIFQDPLTSLNPVYPIGEQIVEAMLAHQRISKKQAMQRAIELLQLTGIPSPQERYHQYPHQLSGGMRQRVMIAIALACRPKLLIADEPTTALDVTIQAQIMSLLARLNKQLNMSILLITHDLGIVAETCHKVVVMYLGQVVETASVQELFQSPRHPYTQALLQAMPRIDSERGKPLTVIEGSLPTLNQLPQGCRFVSRCSYATEKCHSASPILKPVEGVQALVRCWNADLIKIESRIQGQQARSGGEDHVIQSVQS